MAVGTYILKEVADLLVVIGEIDISGYVEVYIAIVIDISEGTTRAPETCANAGGIRNVGKAVLAGIVIELVGPDRGDVKIGPSIVVVIRRTPAHSKSEDSDARGLRHIREFSIPGIPVQAMPRSGRDLLVH